MNNLSNVCVVAATVVLAGCATSAHRSTMATTNVKSADTTIRACETMIYYSPDADSAAALDCARVLDIWR